MAIISGWGFTNTTPASHPVTPTLIDTDTDYAMITDVAGKCVLKNVTCPLGQEERITFQVEDINKVTRPSDKGDPKKEDLLYPPKLRAGRSINVKTESLKRCTSTTDDTFTEDLPCKVSITLQYTRNPQITAADLKLLVDRAYSSLFDSDDSGNTRLDNLMLMQVNPNN